MKKPDALASGFQHGPKELYLLPPDGAAVAAAALNVSARFSSSVNSVPAGRVAE